MIPPAKETRRMRKILTFTVLALVAAAPAVASQALDPAPGKQVTIAVVRDGPTPAQDIAALVEGELNGPTEFFANVSGRPRLRSQNQNADVPGRVRPRWHVFPTAPPSEKTQEH